MANSTLITDYLGRGTHAARPAAPPIAAGALAVYYETDTTNTFVWNGAAWVQVNGGGGGGGGIAYDPTILAEASLVHYWKLNDALGSASAADSKGATALTANGGVSFGSRSITKDNLSSCFFDNVLADYLTFPNGLIPGTAFSLELVLQSSMNGNVFFSADANKNFDLFTDVTGTGFHLFTGGGTQSNFFGGNFANATFYTLTAPTHIVITYDGAGHTIPYVNGFQLSTLNVTPSQTGAGRVGSWANGAAGASNAFGGHIAKLALYSAALTRAQVLAHYANL